MFKLPFSIRSNLPDISLYFLNTQKFVKWLFSQFLTVILLILKMNEISYYKLYLSVLSFTQLSEAKRLGVFTTYESLNVLITILDHMPFENLKNTVDSQEKSKTLHMHSECGMQL